MPLQKLKNSFVSETGIRFCAIDLQISFLALAIASKKLSKAVSETRTKWSRFGAVSETWGLALKYRFVFSKVTIRRIDPSLKSILFVSVFVFFSQPSISLLNLSVYFKHSQTGTQMFQKAQD